MFSLAQGEVATLVAVVLVGKLSVWVYFRYTNILRPVDDTTAIFLSLSCPKLLPNCARCWSLHGLSSRTALFRSIAAGKLKVRDLLHRPRLRNE